uniref:C2H2-type domain-containing protein n=1 Tax=Ananas comosus var. bracteatus TaxID=296719 RepID=A0A6V7PKG7_ANACO|nr:unnamed protein product [Ananas comosus var. bracteatus]
MPTQMYKCSVCLIEFPTAQAYGGHMSSHSKARKAQFGVDENWVRPKRARPIHQSPIDPDDQQQSSFATDDNNYLEEFDVPQEVKKEDAFDEEEDEELRYLINDVANAEPLRRDLEAPKTFKYFGAASAGGVPERAGIRRAHELAQQDATAEKSGADQGAVQKGQWIDENEIIGKQVGGDEEKKKKKKVESNSKGKELSKE